jgi:hypothetical protein
MDKPKETLLRNEDGVLSNSKICLFIPMLIIMLWLVRDLVYQTPLNWEHTTLFIFMLLGGIVNRMDAKRLGSRLKNISISKEGFNVEMVADPDLKELTEADILPDSDQSSHTEVDYSFKYKDDQ